MDEQNNNIFDMLDSPSTNETLHITSTSTVVSSLRRSHISSIPATNGSYSSVQKTSSKKRKPARRTDRALQDLGFVNPGPKNLVNVANVPSRRLKTREPSTQDKPNSIKPLYTDSGLLVSDQTDRCDCNRLSCSGCFLPCTSCQSSKCGLECRNLRTYTYEYRLYGTNKEIVQS
ncbi:hypothetical protein I4U23_007677 [Adineta vaga]|nr:hypothetical protein I4U23_007677 [Adineta vaga]